MSNKFHYLDIADFFVIAETILGIDAKALANKHTIDRAESALHAPTIGFGDRDVYESIEAKAAVLCSRIARNHPLPDGNKRTAFICLNEFLHRNGYRWTSHQRDPDETVRLIERVAAGDLSEDEFTGVVAQRIERL